MQDGASLQCLLKILSPNKLEKPFHLILSEILLMFKVKTQILIFQFLSYHHQILVCEMPNQKLFHQISNHLQKHSSEFVYMQLSIHSCRLSSAQSHHNSTSTKSLFGLSSC
jgi:hypothetical protein